MSGTIGSTGFVNVGNTQTLDEINRPQGTGGPQKPLLGTEPPPVGENDPESGGRPRLDPPRTDPKDMPNLLTQLLKKLDTSEGGDISSIMENLQRAQQELGELQEKNQTEEIKGNKNRIDQNTKDQIAKIKEAAEKLKADQGWETAKKVFAVAGAILGVIAAIGMAVASGGVGLPGAIAITTACVGAIVTVLQVSGAQDAIFDALKLDNNARMWVQIAIAGVLLVGAAASIITSFTSVANAAANVAQTAGKVETVVRGGLNIVGYVAKEAPSMVVSGFKLGLMIAGRVSQGLMAASKVGEGIGAGVQTGLRYEVAQIGDQRKELERANLRIKQQQQELIEAMKDLMKMLEDGVKTTAEVVKGQSEINTKMMHNMS